MDDSSHTPSRFDIGSRNKSEVITLRINPKVKFGLELMARLHNRSVAQTVEMAIFRLLRDPFDGMQHTRDVAYDRDIIDKLWSPHRGERLLRMVLEHRELLSYEEELVWNKMARAGLLSEYFKNPADLACPPVPGYDQRGLEDRIARFWDDLDAAEQDEAARKKKAKEKKAP